MSAGYERRFRGRAFCRLWLAPLSLASILPKAVVKPADVPVIRGTGLRRSGVTER